jgi:hypothetical protein
MPLQDFIDVSFAPGITLNLQIPQDFLAADLRFMQGLLQ